MCVLSAELLEKLPFLVMRLRASESTVEQLRRRNAGETHLSLPGPSVPLTIHNYSQQLCIVCVCLCVVLSARMCSAENQIEELRRQRSGLTHNYTFTHIDKRTHKTIKKPGNQVTWFPVCSLAVNQMVCGM